MARLAKADLEAIRDTIKSTGELRLHVQWSRSGLTTKARLWHPDGHVVGSAAGGGYDKEGSAVAEAIMLLMGSEVAALPDRECGISAALESYPVLSDDDYSERQWNAAREYWASCGLRERIRICAKYDVSILAARRDTMPEDNSGEMLIYLAEGC